MKKFFRSTWLPKSYLSNSGIRKTPGGACFIKYLNSIATLRLRRCDDESETGFDIT